MKRRTFIKNSTLTVISISAFGALNWNGKYFEGNTPTTTDILGPFYRPKSPTRSNLRLSYSKGIPLTLRGVVFQEGGKKPIKKALVEIWHCDENQIYDNTSDEYRYRGKQKTKANGKYQFKTIIPVPYKANPNDNSSWRPAHIHLRVSVPNQQDLITQLYFKGGKHLDTDKWASHPQAAKRILTITKNTSNESEIIFNIIMGSEIPLEENVYKRIEGLYEIGNENFVEFTKSDDLLFMKQNGLLVEALKYIGENTFKGGIGYPKATFELQKNGIVKVIVQQSSNTNYSGIKVLKYN